MNKDLVFSGKKMKKTLYTKQEKYIFGYDNSALAII